MNQAKEGPEKDHIKIRGLYARREQTRKISGGEGSGGVSGLKRRHGRGRGTGKTSTTLNQTGEGPDRKDLKRGKGWEKASIPDAPREIRAPRPTTKQKK